LGVASPSAGASSSAKAMAGRTNTALKITDFMILASFINLTPFAFRLFLATLLKKGAIQRSRVEILSYFAHNVNKKSLPWAVTD
jgi:hypothetical protein